MSGFAGSGHTPAFALVRVVPLTVVSRCSNIRAQSADDLVGAREQRRRHIEAKRLRGVPVGDQIKRGRDNRVQAFPVECATSSRGVTSGKAELMAHRSHCYTMGATQYLL